MAVQEEHKLIYDAITATATAVAVLVAATTYYLQSRRERFQRGVDLMLQFSDAFVNDALITARRKAGNGLVAGDQDDADAVIDFFETVALCVREGAIDKKLVWHSLFYWINHYRFATMSYVEGGRKNDKTVWEDFVWLHDQLLKIETKKRGCSQAEIVPTDNDRAFFAKSESTLLTG